jgi:hypothetical protein
VTSGSSSAVLAGLGRRLQGSGAGGEMQSADIRGRPSQRVGGAHQHIALARCQRRPRIGAELHAFVRKDAEDRPIDIVGWAAPLVVDLGQIERGYRGTTIRPSP